MTSEVHDCPLHKPTKLGYTPTMIGGYSSTAPSCNGCVVGKWEERKMILDEKIKLVNYYIEELKADIDEIKPYAAESEFNKFKLSLLQKKLDICEKEHKELKRREWMDSLWTQSLYA